MVSSAIHPPLFTVGDIILVDDINRIYITEIRAEVNDQFFKVHHIIENRGKVNVTQARYFYVVPIFESTSSTTRQRVNQHLD